MSPSRSVAFCCNAALQSGLRFRNSVGHARDIAECVVSVSPSSSSLRPLSTSPNPMAMSEIAERRGGFPWKRTGTPNPHTTLGSVFHHPSRQQFSSIGEAKNNDEVVPSNSSPWRVAIVGSGPSGCYTAKYLMMGASSKLPPSRSSLSIDVIERLPTPYGLVRNGVAPDHPEVKNVQNDFDVLFEESKSNNTTHEIRFYGNVTVGDSTSNSDSTSDNENTSDVALDELRALYDVVILAYGCESDRELDLPVDVLGEDGSVQMQTETRASDLKGILSAREFVNWYNGHPDYDWVTEEVKDALWKHKTASEQEERVGTTRVTQNIVVVGHGNVALDCARILAKSRGTLDPTDLTTRAIDVLRPQASSAPNNTNTNTNTEVQRSISVVGRRGHVQAAFTIKEARELTKLVETDNAELVLRIDELDMGGGTEASKEELKARPRARIHKLLEGHAKQSNRSSSNTKETNQQLPTNATTQVHLRFLTNPVRFEATPKNGDGNKDQLRLSSVVCERTELEGETPGAQNARGTGSTETTDADLCLVSIGYKGLPIDSSTKASFDTVRGVLKNDHGRVVVPEDIGNGKSNINLAPLYVSGWLKRGPSGIIGTNIGDAKDTVVSILKDLGNGVITKPSLPSSSSSSSSSPLESLLQERKIRYVEWDNYRKITQCESSKSESDNVLGHQKRHVDQPREKIVDRETLLQAAEADR